MTNRELPQGTPPPRGAKETETATMDAATLIADIFALVPVPPAARDDVLARMSGRDRHYHGIDHLAQLWGCHLRHGAGLSVCSPPWHRLIACAVAFHDAVYDPARRDNETESAALWRAASPALEAGEIDWVGETILATADHLNAAPDPGMAPDAWQARLWMLDLDLTPLGAAEADFIANTGRLRAIWTRRHGQLWGQQHLGGGAIGHQAGHELVSDAPSRNLSGSLIRPYLPLLASFISCSGLALVR